MNSPRPDWSDKREPWHLAQDYDDDMDFGPELPFWGPFIKATIIMVIVIAALAWIFLTPARAHEWFPPNCCSGFDCRVIELQDVQITPQGFVIPGNPEVVPFTSPKIKRTPPEGDSDFALCTRGGKPDGEVLCLYIPNWGA